MVRSCDHDMFDGYSNSAALRLAQTPTEQRLEQTLTLISAAQTQGTAAIPGMGACRIGLATEMVVQTWLSKPTQDTGKCTMLGER